jgi:Zn-dependent protease
LSPIVILLSFVILVLSLSFHEAAHAFTADRLGDPTARMLGRLTLNPIAHIDMIGTVLFPLVGMATGLPLIGWAKPVPVNPRNLRRPRQDFAVVALAGPVSNLILAVGAVVLFKIFLFATHSEATDPTITRDVLIAVAGTNTLLAVFNMLPVPPLDGGNVLMGVVPESVARSIAWLRPYGFLVLYALILTNALSGLFFPVFRLVDSWFR